MGYIIVLLLVVVIVPLLIMMLTRRTSRSGGIASADHGLTPDQPSSDQPTPRPGPGVDRNIPPG